MTTEPRPHGYGTQPSYPDPPSAPMSPPAVPYWYGTPVVPPPRRSIRRVVAIVGIATTVVISVLGLATGFALGARTQTQKPVVLAAPSPGAPAPAPTTGITGKKPTTIAPGDRAALTKHLVAPAGVETLTPGHSVHGFYDLDHFLQLFSPPGTEKTLLHGFGFQMAVANDWMSGRGVETVSRLVQFTNAAGAHNYVDQQNAAYTGDEDVAAADLIRGTSPDFGNVGYAYRKPVLDEDGNREDMLICQDGPIVISMFFYTGGQLDWTSELAQLQRQIDALAR